MARRRAHKNFLSSEEECSISAVGNSRQLHAASTQNDSLEISKNIGGVLFISRIESRTCLCIVFDERTARRRSHVCLSLHRDQRKWISTRLLYVCVVCSRVMPTHNICTIAHTYSDAVRHCFANSQFSVGDMNRFSLSICAKHCCRRSVFIRIQNELKHFR